MTQSCWLSRCIYGWLNAAKQICQDSAVLITARVAMQAKELSFLHVFHHSFVVVMAFLWLDAAQSLQQIALLVNTSIQVLMYWYAQKHPFSG